MLIDVHAHLTDARYEGRGDEIAARAKENGVGILVDTGTNRVDMEEAFARAGRLPFVYCAVGIHPEFAAECDGKTLARLAELAGGEKTVAIGEIGLDYFHKENPPRDVQKAAFVAQIELADRVGLPVVTHVRDAHGDAAAILREHAEKLKNGVLIHCYSGSREMLREYDKVDAYYSFGGAITFKNAREKAETLRAARRDRLLLETDCPCMTPEPFRGRTNYPEYVRYTAVRMAEILEITPEEAEEITAENAFRLFGRMKQ